MIFKQTLDLCNISSHTNTEATTYIIPGMNHILREQKENPSMLKFIESYKLPETIPIHPTLLEKNKHRNGSQYLYTKEKIR